MVEAAKAGDIVVVTIPLKHYRTVPAEPLVGKVVIDTNNYYPQRDGQIPELRQRVDHDLGTPPGAFANVESCQGVQPHLRAQLTTDGRPSRHEGTAGH